MRGCPLVVCVCPGVRSLAPCAPVRSGPSELILWFLSAASLQRRATTQVPIFSQVSPLRPWYMRMIRCDRGISCGDMGTYFGSFRSCRFSPRASRSLMFQSGTKSSFQLSLVDLAVELRYSSDVVSSRRIGVIIPSCCRVPSRTSCWRNLTS